MGRRSGGTAVLPITARTPVTFTIDATPSPVTVTGTVAGRPPGAEVVLSRKQLPVDRADELREDAALRDTRRSRRARAGRRHAPSELVVNVSEELALEALTFRLERLLAPA